MKSNLKKVLSLALILMMVVSTMVILPLTTNAAEAGVDYTGTGASADDPIVILTPAGFAAIMGVNRSSKIYIELGNNIDMTGVSYKCAKSEGGTSFDGKGYTVSNLTVSSSTSGTDAGGLFATTKKGTSIKNVTLENLTINTSAKWVGGLVGDHCGSGGTSFTNCHVSGTITTTSTDAVCAGGIIGLQQVNESYLTNCTANVAISAMSATSLTAGGIFGNYDTYTGNYIELKLINCKAKNCTYSYPDGLTPTMTHVLYGKVNKNLKPEKFTLYNDPEPEFLEVDFSIRLKLTDDFGFMAIAEGVDGFVFTTDAEADVAALDKVAGQTYNESETKVYATYTELTAAHLDTVIYFAAYATTEDGSIMFTELKAINVYEVAKDLQDGKYGETTITTDGTEMTLYVKMCEYCDAYKAYLAKNGLAA